MKGGEVGGEADRGPWRPLEGGIFLPTLYQVKIGATIHVLIMFLFFWQSTRKSALATVLPTSQWITKKIKTNHDGNRGSRPNFDLMEGREEDLTLQGPLWPSLSSLPTPPFVLSPSLSLYLSSVLPLFLLILPCWFGPDME